MSDTLWEKLDEDNIKIKLSAKRKDFEYVSCKLCMCKPKYSKLGLQALVQHSAKE